MTRKANFFQRAVNAIVEGRTRQAERFIARFEREHNYDGSKLNDR